MTSVNGTSGDCGLSAEINVTPLIDVLLVMLIIFMVIVPVMPRGLNSVLPSAALADPANSFTDGPILVQIEPGLAGARFLVDGVALERTELVPRLVERLSRRSVRQMLLKADANLDYAVVAGVIDAGRTAGAESIALITPGSEARAR